VVPVSSKALEYAEDTLGVHKIYEDAQTARKDLDECLTKLSEARDKKRDLEFRIADHEQEVAADEWGKHPDMAQTRMDKHLKNALWRNDDWRELREQLSKVTGDVEGLEYDRAVAEADLRIAVSRMQELGGYLQYLAAVKLASVKTREAGETK
jgi:chromosome segregation ATPase